MNAKQEHYSSHLLEKRALVNMVGICAVLMYGVAYARCELEDAGMLGLTRWALQSCVRGVMRQKPTGMTFKNRGILSTW